MEGGRDGGTLQRKPAPTLSLPRSVPLCLPRALTIIVINLPLSTPDIFLKCWRQVEEEEEGSSGHKRREVLGQHVFLGLEKVENGLNF